MIITMKNDATTEKINEFSTMLKNEGHPFYFNKSTHCTIIGLLGNISNTDYDRISHSEIVESVNQISEPYRMVNRKLHPDDTIVTVNNNIIGEGYFNVIAGPCSVENEEQILEVAKSVKKSGAKFLRGGAYKPRTSPYAFQGLQEEGIELLLKAKKQTGLAIVSEIMDISHIDLFADIDIIQVGARNMQNFSLLKELGKCRKPILLKRGIANTIDEWLMSAEYIMSGGNSDIILCERGIRTFETASRNTMDITAIPMIKRMSHLPVIIDPSHAAGLTWLVEPLSKAAIAAGADGLIIEVHNDPSKALCDGAQSLTPVEFDKVMDSVRTQVAFEGKIFCTDSVLKTK